MSAYQFFADNSQRKVFLLLSDPLFHPVAGSAAGYALRAPLRLSGQESETWILTRVGDKAKGAVLVVEPITGTSAAHSPT